MVPKLWGSQGNLGVSTPDTGKGGACSSPISRSSSTFTFKREREHASAHAPLRWARFSSFDASSRRRPPPTTSHQASLSYWPPLSPLPLALRSQPRDTGHAGHSPPEEGGDTLATLRAHARAARERAHSAGSRSTQRHATPTYDSYISTRPSLGTGHTRPIGHTRPNRSLTAVVPHLGPGFDSRGGVRPGGGSRTRRLAGQRH